MARAERGSALVSTIVAVGIIGIIATGLARVWGNSQQSARYFEQKAGWLTFVDNARGILDNPRACAASLSGLTMTASAQSFSFKQSSGTVIYQLNQKMDHMILTKMTATVLNPVPTGYNLVRIDLTGTKMTSSSSPISGAPAYSTQFFLNVLYSGGVVTCIGNERKKDSYAGYMPYLQYVGGFSCAGTRCTSAWRDLPVSGGTLPAVFVAPAAGRYMISVAGYHNFNGNCVNQVGGAGGTSLPAAIVMMRMRYAINGTTTQRMLLARPGALTTGMAALNGGLTFNESFEVSLAQGSALKIGALETRMVYESAYANCVSDYWIGGNVTLTEE